MLIIKVGMIRHLKWGHHKKRSYHQFGSNKLKQLSHDILK
jgi:hypothetical protein